MAATVPEVKLLVDYRETKLLQCLEEHAAAKWNPHATVLVERRNLVLGDIWIVSGQSSPEEANLVVLYERKTVADLLASIKDGRYEEQSHRLSHSSLLRQPHQAVYLLEGALPHARHHDMRMIYSALTSLNVYKGFSVMRSMNVNETADYLMAQATKIAKETRESRPRLPWAWTTVVTAPPTPSSTTTSSPQSFVQDVEQGDGEGPGGGGGGKVVTAQDYCDVVKKVKKENITRDNIESIMLSQVPGISAQTAKSLLVEFGSLFQLLRVIKESPDDIVRCKLPSSNTTSPDPGEVATGEAETLPQQETISKSGGSEVARPGGSKRRKLNSNISEKLIELFREN